MAGLNTIRKGKYPDDPLARLGRRLLWSVGA